MTPKQVTSEVNTFSNASPWMGNLYTIVELIMLEKRREELHCLIKSLINGQLLTPIFTQEKQM